MMKKVEQGILLILLCTTLTAQAEKPFWERAQYFAKGAGALVLGACNVYFLFDSAKIIYEQEDIFKVIRVHSGNLLSQRQAYLMGDKGRTALKEFLRYFVSMIAYSYVTKKSFESAKLNLEKAFEKEKASQSTQTDGGT